MEKLQKQVDSLIEAMLGIVDELGKIPNPYTKRIIVRINKALDSVDE